MRTRSFASAGHGCFACARCASAAPATASPPLRKTAKHASPCLSTKYPSEPSTASCISRRWIFEQLLVALAPDLAQEPRRPFEVGEEERDGAGRRLDRHAAIILHQWRPPSESRKSCSTGFDRHYELFRTTSAQAKEAFEAGDWARVQRLVQERIRFYDDARRSSTSTRLRDELDAESLDDSEWQLAKLIYVGLLVDHKRPELAETFFNSVTTRVLRRTYIHDDLMFMRAAVSTEYIPSEPPTYRSYYPAEPGARGDASSRSCATSAWTRPFTDLERDVGFVMRALDELGERAPRRRRTSRCRCWARPSTATRPRTSSGRS